MKTGDTVELKDGDFLRITGILEGENSIKGWRFCSTTKIRGLSWESPNDVCWIMHTRDGELQDLSKQCVEEIPRSELVRSRRLMLTNQNDPSQIVRTKHFRSELGPVQDQPSLICRWKYICRIKKDRSARLSANVQFYSPDNEWAAIIRIRKEECDEEAKYQIDDNTLSEHWRRQSRKRAGLPRSSNENIDSHDEDLPRLSLDKLRLSNMKQRPSSPPPSHQKMLQQYLYVWRCLLWRGWCIPRCGNGKPCSSMGL